MGALACAAFTRASEIQNVAVTGETWVLVPETIKVVLRGRLPKTVLGKDIFLRLMQDLQETAASAVLEFTGPGVESISVDNRMAVVNGSHLMGCETMIFPPDRVLLDWLKPRAREAFVPVFSDSDAEYLDTVEYDLSEFTPLISAPPALENVKPLPEVLGTKVDLAFIGSCGSARYEDLALAATVLEGKKVHPRVRLVVTPISSAVLRDTARDGIIATLVEAGAAITTPGCGGCYAGNQSPAVLDAGEVCITSSAENGPGRMGSPEGAIYIGNAAVVAASAIEGQIADPARYLSGDEA
jgi:3-isopropylmalate/(R)-2-methylmalate dehydratase large subunit